MQSRSPLGRLAERVHQSRRRSGLAGVAQRLALVVLPAPAAIVPVEPEMPVSELATPEHNMARERARRALVEARRTMSGVIGDETAVVELSDESLPSTIAPDWERLQAYLEESDRERTTLKEELESLRETVRALQSRLDGLERALPSGDAVPVANGAEPVAESQTASVEGEEPEAAAVSTTEATESTADPDATTDNAAPSAEAEGVETPESRAAPDAEMEPAAEDEQVRELRERVLRALRERVFAAGTVGTRVQMSPAPDEVALQGMVERFNEDPLVEHAEPIEAKEGDGETAQIRVTLRAPMRWEQFGALLERALDVPVAQGDVRWSQGAVHVRLPSEPRPDGPEPASDATEPCV